MGAGSGRANGERAVGVAAVVGPPRRGLPRWRALASALLLGLSLLVGLAGEAHATWPNVRAWEATNNVKFTIPDGAQFPHADQVGVYQVFSLGGWFAMWMDDRTIRTFYGQGSVPAPTPPSGTFIKVHCASSLCAAIREDTGAVVVFGGCGSGGGNLYGEQAVPGGLTNVVDVAVASGGCTVYAVKADGTVTAWGQDLEKNSFATAKALTGVKAISASWGHLMALKGDGTVVSKAFKPTFTPSDPTPFDAALNTSPAGLIATQITAGYNINAALKSDGSVVVWGANAGQFSAFPKPVRKLVANSTVLNAILHDGTVHTRYAGGGSQVSSTYGAMADVMDFSATGSYWIAAIHTGCKGIPVDGCCAGDLLKFCSFGAATGYQCSPGTCGWTNTPQGAGMYYWGYTCNTKGGVTIGAPPPACCVPDCKGKNCGDDKCGGTCGSCGGGKVCNASQVCECTKNCDDGNSCTNDDCDANGCVNNANTAPCSTGNKCTANDACSNKACVAGAAVKCDDGDACTTDSCNSGTGCVHASISCDDGNACTTDGCAKASGCTHTANTLPCNDGNACTKDDACAGSKCAGGAAVNCDDGNACTNDSCNPSTGCAHTNSTAPCDDNNKCTQNDVCSNGTCSPGPGLVCNDQNPCTTDSCDPAKGCQTQPLSGPCSDNNACTTGDACADGACKAGPQITCNDGEVCTVDGCDPQKGCTFTAQPPTTTCDDGNVCSTGDHCEAGKCKASAGVDCNDNNPCTNDPCNGSGGCDHTNVADGTSCDDGDACTGTGTCKAGICQGFVGVVCDDGNPCTLDACASASGCSHSNSSLPCDDGDLCTSGDTCSNGACTAGPGCSANGVCTLQSGVGVCVCKKGYVGDGKTCTACVASCQGKDCGSDGCGGQCGVCKGATACNAAFQCQCAPQCAGRACGPDGCGGTCGTCPSGKACNLIDGVCADVCVPKCDGRTCGDNGCGGTCGTCADGQFCLADVGQCQYNVCPSTPAVGCCSGNTLLTCNSAGTTAVNCSATAQHCNWDAAKNTYACIDTASGGDPSGKHPRACGGATTCTPSCKDRVCGPDGCGGSCGSCGKDQLCDFDAGLCYADPCAGIQAEGCCLGDHQVQCDAKTKLPKKTTCGVGVDVCGWTGSAYACGGDGKSDEKLVRACPSNVCFPDCTGKSCGPDGCGGTCGACYSSKEVCSKGACCVPSCAGKNCGSDGCGGSCGSCKDGLVCNSVLGHCMANDQCEGAPADVGCCAGNTFKICKSPFVLSTEDCSTSPGYCGWNPKLGRYGCGTNGAPDPDGKTKLCKGAPACVPDCQGKECGPDGCGGTCPNKCATGSQCTKNFTCEPGCGYLPQKGCCDGNTAYACVANGASGGWSVQAVDCKSKGMSCGFVPTAHPAFLGHYACVEGEGKADPSGNALMQCPATIFDCKPDCDGRECGPDGCGGTCGSCKDYQKCDDFKGQCYIPPPDCKDITWVGGCVGSKLYYCSATSYLVTQECGAPKEKYNGTNVAMCKWSPTTNAFGCYEFVDTYVSSSYASCANAYPGSGSMCGKSASYYLCQCDVDCETRGDCCGDFVQACGEQFGIPRCGDGTCNLDRGETCSTCPADCGASCAALPAGTSPPWLAPFESVLAMALKPSQHAEMVVHPLDNPLPSEPPIPVDGLLTWLPARGVELGSRANHVVFGNLGSGGLVDAPGQQGPSLGLLDGTSAPSGGVVRIGLDKPLPRQAKIGTGAMGGVSLAMWVKVPTAAPNVAHVLASTYGPSANIDQVCAWSRPGDVETNFNCPTVLGVKRKIVAIDGYYGKVDNPPLLQWNAYTRQIHLPNGACAFMDGFEPSHTCTHAGIKALLEQQCLGKTACQVNPWPAVGDPCVADAKDTKLQSTLLVRVLCADDTPPASSLLVVGDSTDKHRLRYQLPGMPPLASTSSLADGAWHHVALVHRPFVGATKAGVTTLFVDGALEASTETLVPPTFTELWLGAGVVAGAPKSAPTAVGAALAAIADLDDVLLYDRALSGADVRALVDKPAHHLVRSWPPVAAKAAVKWPAWAKDGTLSAVPVEADQLLGPGATTTGMQGQKLRASFEAVRAPAGGKLVLPVESADLAGIEDFTLAAWLRVGVPPAEGAPVLRIARDGATDVAIVGSKACSQRALVGQVRDGNGSLATTTAEGCEHGITAGRWAFVSLVRKAGALSLRIDGHEVGTGAATGTLMAGKGTPALELLGDAELAWAGLFDASLSVQDLVRWRGQGPAVWLDGAVYAVGTEARLRDFASFENVGAGSAAAQRPMAWYVAPSGAFGAPATALSPAKGPLTLSANGGKFGSTTGAFALTVPALGRFARDTATSPRPFTWSAHLRFAALAPGEPLVQNLVVHLDGKGGRPFAARLRCQGPQVSAPGPRLELCRIEGVAAAKGWSTGQIAITWPMAKASDALMFDLDVALAWDGGLPSVAIGARGGDATSNGAMTGSVHNPVAHDVNWPDLGKTPWPGDAAVFATMGPGAWSDNVGLSALAVAELRMYARKVNDIELTQLVGRTCGQVSCEQRVCSQVDGAALPTCGPCDGKNFEAGNAMGDTCLPRQPFFGFCTASEQCESGLCHQGRCRALSQTADCVAACGERHRTCVAQKSTVAGVANTQVYGCSASCVKWYTKPTVDPDGGVCLWTPTIADWQACEEDEGCISGKCIDDETPTYSGGKVGGKVCAYATTAVCVAQHRTALASAPTKLTGKPVYTCSGCVQDTYQNQPIWRDAFALLTPGACEKAYNGAWYQPPYQNKKWEMCYHNGNVSLDCLGVLLLGKSKGDKFSLEDIAKLRKLGIGPLLLDDLQTGKNNSGLLGWPPQPLCYCGQCPTYSVESSRWHSPAYNPRLCVGQQFPNGATCPPPGVTVAKGQEGQFCESGFCARDTNRCENGVTRVEDTKSVDRADSKSSNDEQNYGVLAMTQANRATLNVRRVTTSDPDAPPKRSFSLSVSNTQAVRLFFGASFDLVRLELDVRGQMEAKNAQFVPRLFVFGIENPKVKSLTPPTGCKGAYWKDGEYITTSACNIENNPVTSTPTIPSLKFCQPAWKGCETQKNLPKNYSVGPTCIKKTTWVGGIPIQVGFEAKVEPCAELGAAIDSETFEPGFRGGPLVDLAVEVKGGLGVDKLISVFAGVRGGLTLIKLGLPVTWFLRIKQPQNAAGSPIEGLFHVLYYRELSIEMVALRLAVSLFAEIGFGPFKAEWEYMLFEFPGITMSQTIGGAATHTLKLDLSNPLANQ